MWLEVLATFTVLAGAVSPQENGIVIHSGFSTGQEYLEMADAWRRGYAAGFANGMLIAPIVGADEKRIDKFGTCVTGMNDLQGGFWSG
jgi:hypothetical protein